MRYDYADLENPDDVAVSALAPWRHPDAGRDPYFIVLYDCEDGNLSDPAGLKVADNTTWEFRKHQPRLEGLKGTNPRLPRHHPDNLRFLSCSGGGHSNVTTDSVPLC